MKKLLSFLFLMFVPFIVNAADVEIKSITEIERTGDVEVNNEPTFDGMKINFDLAFTNVDDSVTYKVVVKNNTNEDLEIEEEAQYGKDNYIKYTAAFTDGTNVIKANAEKEITIKASYDKEIPVDQFDNGVYNEKGTVQISFVGEKENPATAVFIPIAIITVLAVSVIAILLAKHGMKKTAVTAIVLTLVALPVIGNALRKISFDIEAHIHIQDRCYTLDTTYGSFDATKDVKSICVPFTENKYYIEEEFYSVQWGQRQSDTDNLILNVYKQYFTEESYVRVYDSEDNLLKEITINDFPKPLLNVRTLINYASYRIATSVGNYAREDVRLELSEDLEEHAGYDVAYFMYSGKPGSYTVKGPWIKDTNVIEQIYTLEDYGTEDYVLKEFVRDTKDSHLYHAVWGEPEIIK